MAYFNSNVGCSPPPASKVTPPAPVPTSFGVSEGMDRKMLTYESFGIVFTYLGEVKNGIPHGKGEFRAEIRGQQIFSYTEGFSEGILHSDKRKV